jgi:succinate-semialdehyde dehydrogenase/glutarate-semialdehyde dehydrogenase
MSAMRGLDLIKNRHLVRGSGFLNGKFAPTQATAAGSFDVTNPATGESLISLPRMGAADANLAISHANVAWARWKKTSVNERSKFLSRMTQLMVKYTDDLACIVSLEAGKPFKEAKGEVQYATSFYEFYAEEAKRVTGDIIQSNASGQRRLLVTKQAIGPAALITPWNFPLAMITRKVGPALAAGSSVVIKPAEQVCS